MSTIFLQTKDDFNPLEQLTYDPETKVFTKMTERDDDWKKVIFKVLKSQSINLLPKAFTSIHDQKT